MALPERANPHHGKRVEVYQIRIAGQLTPRWEGWFDGLVIETCEHGDTLLTGPVVDQAALHGLLRKVRDLGLPLISVNGVDIDSLERTDITGLRDLHDGTEDGA